MTYTVNYTLNGNERKAQFTDTDLLEKRLVWLCARNIDATILNEQRQRIGEVAAEQWSYEEILDRIHIQCA